jgi:prolyl-tRNA synthetase
MRQSHLFTKTNKSARTHDSVNATLLQKAGFIDQTMAGVYSYLPLGLRVLNKIEQIIREEMDQIANQVFLPSLSPFELWQQTGRAETIDVLFKASGANIPSRLHNNTEYVLNSTHEELITPIVKRFTSSYKDLPCAAYQIQTKFRNEPRAKSGLLRGREFRMKDLYSFHTSEEDLLRYYHEKAKPAYTKVYQRLGLGDYTVIAMASGGDFTDQYSHEFQTICYTGEDTLFHVPDTDVYYNKEIAPSQIPQSNDGKEKPQALKNIHTPGATSVQKLIKALKVPIEKCIKTLIYQTDEGTIFFAGIRADYDANELKLAKVVNAKYIELVNDDTIRKLTGAEPGYAGIINVPKHIPVYVDDSAQGLVNFECGGNQTDHHYLNGNFGRDLPKPKQFHDFKEAKPGDRHPETGKQYEVMTASEVGNIFPLNTKFSDAFDYQYTDAEGQQHPVYMGCYGLGSSRIMGVIVERFHDDHGIIWPESVAPYQVHLLGLNLEQAEVKKHANQIYDQLTAAGIEVLYDDREDARAGQKFSDADLIGIPYRLVVSPKTGQQIEVKPRTATETNLMDLKEFIDKVNK